MCFSSPDTSAADQASAASAQQAQQTAQREAARQADVVRGTQSINNQFQGFDSGFYGKRAQSYVDWASPQLDDQYKTAKNDLTYGLQRQGILDSSEGARQLGELNKQYGTDRQNLVDTGTDYANQARQSVEQNRSQLIQQLQSGDSSDSVAQSAASRVPTITAQPTFSPLGALFQNITGAAATYNQAAQATGNPGLFSGSNGGVNIFGGNSGSSSRTVG